MQKRYKNFGYAFLVLAVLSLFVYNAISRMTDYPGDGIAIWLGFLLLHCTALIAGIVLIIFRVFGLMKTPDHFWYILVAIVNVGIGIARLLLPSDNSAVSGRIWFQMTHNLLIGSIAVVDIFLLDNLLKRKHVTE